ncbi:sugar ABC transporter ATP-binding protein [Bacillus sp. 1P10SD]|uniref:sugar ABC transporter ATP-binding protein n=1 Tax=Bacillus sp. 1P10SD TaxID=3132265 RepID=UPI0039A674AC
MEQVLQMQNISKSFSGVKILEKVNFGLNKGEVHVLIGENGAGKSTLMKILTGVYPKDEGEILLENKTNGRLKPVEIANPNAAIHLGINMVFQETNLLENMTVAENIFIGYEPSKKGFLDKKAMYSQTEELLKRVHLNISPNTLVGNLTAAQRQSVEIAKSLSHNGRILILDEPTSSLSEREVRTLFAIIAELKAQGVSVVYISHRMEELFEIGDRITVLRDGSFVGTLNVKETNEDEIVSMMIGRKLEAVENTSNQAKRIDYSKVAFECKNVMIGNFKDTVNLKIHSGEIVGLYGLVGSGRSELAQIFYGIDSIRQGSMEKYGKKLSIRNPEQAIKNGIALLSEDRKKYGFIPGKSITDNVVLMKLRELSFFRPSLKEETNIALKYMNDLKVAASSENQSISSLSGGNQQKVVLSKILAMNPDILILDEPTRGVDVGAKAEIYDIIWDLAEAGKAILMISSDLPEILRVSDRVMVMHDGSIKMDEPNENLSQEKILQAALS